MTPDFTVIDGGASSREPRRRSMSSDPIPPGVIAEVDADVLEALRAAIADFEAKPSTRKLSGIVRQAKRVCISQELVEQMRKNLEDGDE